MPRKPVPSAPQSPLPDPEKPAIVQPPKTDVNGEGTRESDAKTQNELVIQRVSVPFTFEKKTEFKNYLRIFVRPDDSHNEPDASWDEHEPEDEAALKQLFATYGKGSGTELTIRLNVNSSTCKEEFFLDVRHPKPEVDEDEKLPSMLVDPKASIGDMVLDLFYDMSGDDPPDDFTTRGALEDLVKEQKGDLEELEPIRSLLDEFDMPGDKPANLYSLHDRLRSIFRAAKGLPK
jgi:hypothetical protein